jgi:hypothetical protein
MFSVLRLARIALVALLGMLCAQAAMAQGNPTAAARALAKLRQDVAGGLAAVKACNYKAWTEAKSTYDRDEYQYDLVSGKLHDPRQTPGGPNGSDIFPDYPEPCPPKGATLVPPPPTAPPPTVQPVAHGIHRETACSDCKGLLKQLNDAIDNYAQARSRHDPDQSIFAAEVTRLSRNLDDCEKFFCPKQTGYLGGGYLGGNEPGDYCFAGGRTTALSFMLNGLLDFGDDNGLQNFVGGASGVDRINRAFKPVKPASCGLRGAMYFGGELAKNSGSVRSTETRDATGIITNQFVDSGDPLGAGVVVGAHFNPRNSNFVFGPFASFDYLNQTINHNFAGGQFLGTTTHWFINAGMKAGVIAAPGLYIYGLAGAAFLNHDLNVNFATAAQSNTTTPGFTAGVGGEYQPSSWHLAGHPVSVFAQYQHTWWSSANFNTPTSSPAFNYAFRREDDTVKLGVNFYFGAAPAPAAPAYPVKAPMLK